MYRNSQENECDGNFSACFIVWGSTGNLEYLGNKVHLRTIRKWSSRGWTLFPANFSQWLDKKRKQKQLLSALCLVAYKETDFYGLQPKRCKNSSENFHFKQIKYQQLELSLDTCIFEQQYNCMSDMIAEGLPALIFFFLPVSDHNLLFMSPVHVRRLLWIHDDVDRNGKWKAIQHPCDLLLWNTVFVSPREREKKTSVRNCDRL